jgi:hypothetical protein
MVFIYYRIQYFHMNRSYYVNSCSKHTEIRNAHKILGRNPEEKWPLDKLRPKWKPLDEWASQTNNIYYYSINIVWIYFRFWQNINKEQIRL